MIQVLQFVSNSQLCHKFTFVVIVVIAVIVVIVVVVVIAVIVVRNQKCD